MTTYIHTDALGSVTRKTDGTGVDRRGPGVAVRHGARKATARGLVTVPVAGI
ncbi:Hypothetical protein I596_1000 [Dokdonella koreensis DS-123]|uniref:Uncharacterized protein n=1 Tax=Dokdonella koreensis DS-123 TaxID=1300342 RepID=A0A160DSX3_9GAMM|nr:Hypothetical protein I596_1000 [Dokdonella koreensis DS-123]